MSIPRFSETRSQAIREGLVAEVESRRRPLRRGWINIAVFAMSGALVGGAVSGAAWAAQGDAVPNEPSAVLLPGGEVDFGVGDGAREMTAGTNTGVAAPPGVNPGQPIVSLLAGGGTALIDVPLNFTPGPIPAGATHIRVTVTCLEEGRLSWGQDAGGNNPSLSCNASDASDGRGRAWYDFDLASGATLYFDTDSGSFAVTWQFVNLVETAWGVNAAGETFGVSKADGSTPDYILVSGTAPDGTVVDGYARADELEGPQPDNPEEAATWNSQPFDVPLYEPKGFTQIGVFRVGG